MITFNDYSYPISPQYYDKFNSIILISFITSKIDDNQWHVLLYSLSLNTDGNPKSHWRISVIVCKSYTCIYSLMHIGQWRTPIFIVFIRIYIALCILAKKLSDCTWYGIIETSFKRVKSSYAEKKKVKTTWTTGRKEIHSVPIRWG